MNSSLCRREQKMILIKDTEENRTEDQTASPSSLHPQINTAIFSLALDPFSFPLFPKAPFFLAALPGAPQNQLVTFGSFPLKQRPLSVPNTPNLCLTLLLHRPSRLSPPVHWTASSLPSSVAPAPVPPKPPRAPTHLP